MSGEELWDVPWFDANWMFVGPLLGLLLTVLPLPALRPGHPPPPTLLRQLTRGLLLTYTLHQFEEHGWDAKARRYAFRTFLNSVLEPTLGVDVSVRQVTLVNTVLVWVGHAFAVVALEVGGLLVPAAFHWSLATFNAGAHLSGWLASGEYNPGVVQSSVQLMMGVTFLKHYLAARSGGAPWLVLLVLLVAGGPVAHFGGILLPLLGGLGGPSFAAVQVGVAVGLPLALTPLLEGGRIAPAVAHGSGSVGAKKTD